MTSSECPLGRAFIEMASGCVAKAVLIPEKKNYNDEILRVLTAMKVVSYFKKSTFLETRPLLYSFQFFSGRLSLELSGHIDDHITFVLG